MTTPLESTATFYCPVCGSDTQFGRSERQETYEVRGEQFIMNVPLLVCRDCGFDEVEESFGDPVARAFEAYRAKYDMLSPDATGRQKRFGS